MATDTVDTTGAATRHRPFLVELYRSAVGKKYVMAITGLIGMGYLLAHLIGNLKIYLGAEGLDHYGEWLRGSLGYPILPHTWTLWLLRIVLIVALILHVHAAYALTLMNRRARPDAYRSRRDYIAADFAARTMRWTGIIVLLFIVYHLADFTWGVDAVNPDFQRGAVYDNVSASMGRPAVAAFYAVAQIALGVHLYHGTWSMFQSFGIGKTREAVDWRHLTAIGFTALIVVGNLSFPIVGVLGLFRPEGLL